METAVIIDNQPDEHGDGASQNLEDARPATVEIGDYKDCNDTHTNELIGLAHISSFVSEFVSKYSTYGYISQASKKGLF